MSQMPHQSIKPIQRVKPIKYAVFSLIAFCLVGATALRAQTDTPEFDLTTLSTLPDNAARVYDATLDAASTQRVQHRGARHCNMKIFSTASGEFISRRALRGSIDPQATVVLGEFHYNQNIQDAEAALIRVLANDSMPVAWEFLEFPDQAFQSKIFQTYSENRLRTSVVTDLQFPLQADGSNATYNAVMLAVKSMRSSIVATNAPRPVKAQLMDFGYATLDESFKPPLFNMDNASEDYFERFYDALGGGAHPLPRPIEAYFESQYYTDEVIAWQAQNARILIVGTFHSDFNDGIIPRIPVYSSRPVANIKVLDGELLSDSEIEEFLQGSELYGTYADFIVIACGDSGC